jgi:hypothetical protein
LVPLRSKKLFGTARNLFLLPFSRDERAQNKKTPRRTGVF